MGGGLTDQTGMRNQKRYDKSVKEEHIDLAFIESFIKLLDGSTLKCRNALGFDFTALTLFCFTVALLTCIS